MPDDNKHIYLSGIVVVIVGAMLAAIGSVFTRIDRAEEQVKNRVDGIEKRMLNQGFFGSEI